MNEEEKIFDDIESARQHLTNQIRANQHIENQAGRLFRIWLTMLGLLVTSASIYFTATNQLTFPVNPSPDIVSLSEQIADSIPLLSRGMTIVLITNVFAFGGGVLLLYALLNLFFVPPLSALKTYKSKVKEPELGVDEGTTIQLTATYLDRIKKNERALNETRKHWDKCHSSLRTGVKALPLSLIPLATAFIDIGPIAIVSVLVAYAIFVRYLLRPQLDEVVNLFRIYRKMDLVNVSSSIFIFGAFLASGLFNVSREIFSALLLTGVLLTVPAIFIKYYKDEFLNLLLRNAIVWLILSLTIASLLEISPLDDPWFWLALGVLAIWLSITLTTFMIIYSHLYNRSLRWAKSRVSGVTERIPDLTAPDLLSRD